MSREKTLRETLDVLALVQRILTVASSGFNSLYFATYHRPTRGHRFEVVLLAFMNLAILMESLYLGLPRLLWGGGEQWLLDDPRVDLVAGSLPLVVSFLITVLILRRLGIRRRS